MSSEDVSMVDVKLELKVFWYHLHPSCTEGSLSPLSFRQHLSVPNCSVTLGSESPCAHFLNISVDVLVEACVHCSDSLFMYGKFLYHCYKLIWNH